MNKAQLRQVLSDAVMGDESALDRLTEVIGAQEGSATDPDFYEAVAEFRSEYRDVVSNPDDNAALVNLDARLAREHPELDYRQRLRIAGNQIRSGGEYVASQEADRSSAIEAMRLERDPQARAARWQSNLDDNDSDAIGRMAQDRANERIRRMQNGG